MTSRAQAPGSLPRPGPIGRTARFALGIVTAAVLVAVALPRLERPPGSESPSPLAWYLFLLVELSLGVLAISFITASILAVPG